MVTILCPLEIVVINPCLGNTIPLPSPHIIPVPFHVVGTAQSFELGKPIIGKTAEIVIADGRTIRPATSQL